MISAYQKTVSFKELASHMGCSSAKLIQILKHDETAPKRIRKKGEFNYDKKIHIGSRTYKESRFCGNEVRAWLKKREASQNVVG